jgi:hypothetical protein
LFFEWVRQQPEGSKITGYTNHVWNGLSSDAFAQIVAAIVKSGGFRAGVQHLVPSDVVTKDALVRMVLDELQRADVEVAAGQAEHKVDRTLATDDPGFNQELFEIAGYKKLPTIREMVSRTCSELAN